MAMARGVWFVGPRRVEIADVDVAPLTPGHVQVHTLCSGISAGTELLAYRGDVDPDLPLDDTIGALGGTFRYPFRYGYSCVGVVEASLADLPEGARVFAFHPHQDRFVTAAANVIPLGDVEPRVAALFPLVETALQVSLDAGQVLDERVIVFGLGAVGLLTAVLLRRAGARVVAVEPLPWRRAAAGRLGVDAIPPDQVAGAIPDGGVPLVVEVTGQPSVLSGALGLLAHEGTALVVSWYGRNDVPLPLGGDFHRRRLTIRSSQVSTIPARLADRWTVARRREVVRELLGELALDVVATHAVPFDDAPEAYAALDRREEGLIHTALWYG